jgi:hypothetical protein
MFLQKLARATDTLRAVREAAEVAEKQKLHDFLMDTLEELGAAAYRIKTVEHAPGHAFIGAIYMRASNPFKNIWSPHVQVNHHESWHTFTTIAELAAILETPKPEPRPPSHYAQACAHLAAFDQHRNPNDIMIALTHAILSTREE